MKVKDAEGNTREINIFFDEIPTGGVGKPRKVFTEEGLKLVENLSKIMTTEDEMCAIFGCSRDTFHTEWNDEKFRQAKMKGQAEGKMSLQRKQYEVAMKGNVNMLKWLGIQHLKQSHRVEVDANVSKDEKLNLMEQYIDEIKGENKETIYGTDNSEI